MKRHWITTLMLASALVCISAYVCLFLYAAGYAQEEPPVPEATVTPYLEPPLHPPQSTPVSELVYNLWLPMVVNR